MFAGLSFGTHVVCSAMFPQSAEGPLQVSH